METLIADPRLSQRLIDERQARGIDIHDEIWEGVYVMAPAPNDEHQDIELGLSEPLVEVVKKRGCGVVRMRVNVTSDPNNWEHDYRIPDIVVFLNGSAAVCYDTFWSGPPDFVVEIASPGDKSRQKLSFYSKIGTKELLLVERHPWRLELYRMQEGHLALFANCTPDDSVVIKSSVLPLQFQLLSAAPRPSIEVTAVDTQQLWMI